LNQNASFCVGASGSATLSYQWYFNGSSLGALANSSTLALNAVGTNNAGSYTVVVKNNYGSVTSAVAMLTVSVPPGITTQPASQAVVLGQNASVSVVANGTTPFSYQWNLNGAAVSAATNSTLSLTNVQATQAGSYTVVVTNVAGSITSQVAILTVNIPAGIATQPQSQTVVQGQNASFSVAASGTTPFSYQWNLNGAAVSAATNSTLSLTNVQATQAASYTVVVTNVAGSITSQVAILTVNIPAGIATQPQSQTVVQGQNASFSVVASGTTPFSYQWNLNGAAVSVATNSTLSLTNVQTTQAGSYAVVVTNAGGSVTSTVAVLTLILPPAITNQPQSQTVAAGQSASFSVGANGAPTTYQWNFNGTALSGAANSTLTLTNVRTTNAGSYMVVAMNIAGSVTSAVASLTVTNPNIALSLPSGTGMTHAGFTVQFSAPVGVTYVVLASTDLNNWSPIATNVASGASAVFTNTTATNYSQRFYKVMLP